MQIRMCFFVPLSVRVLSRTRGFNALGRHVRVNSGISWDELILLRVFAHVPCVICFVKFIYCTRTARPRELSEDCAESELTLYVYANFQLCYLILQTNETLA